MSATLRQIVEQSGKLYSWVAAWIGSYSIAAIMWKPACSNPSDRPPAPAKRSTPIGRSPFPFIEHTTSLMFYRLGEGIANYQFNRCWRECSAGDAGDAVYVVCKSLASQAGCRGWIAPLRTGDADLCNGRLERRGYRNTRNRRRELRSEEHTSELQS